MQTITDGPDLPMRGTVVERDAGNSTRVESCAVVGAVPMVVGASDGARIWRHGRKLRVENSSGVPVFISDGVVAWDFAGNQAAPRKGSVNNVRYLGSAQFLMNRSGATEWTGDDVTRPMRHPPKRSRTSGPSVSDEELNRRRLAEYEQHESEKRRWFEQEVTNQVLRVRVPMNLTPERIYTVDEESGAFEAGLKGDTLARRRRSDLAWVPGWVGVVHR